MTREPVFDAAIVGGGPAGSSAALHLAEGGLSVCVIEKAALPRYKTCGGGVVWRARTFLPPGFDGFVERLCHSAEVHVAGTGLSFETERRNPIITMTMRDTLDARLLQAALDRGARLIADCSVTDIVPAGDAVRLVTTKGTVDAHVVIAADGATGSLAKKAGWTDSLEFIPALEWEVYPEPDRLEAFHGRARFDFGFVPHGYAWVFPKERHLSIGVLTKKRADLNAALQRYMTCVGLRGNERTERHGYVIPWGPRKGGFARGRIFLAGDTAGFVDPITGEGISYALLSGRLAARAILDAGLDPQRAGQLYEQTLASSILTELKLGGWISRLVYDSPGLRNLLFRMYGKRLSEAVTDVLMGERTYKGILGSPRTYLKLLQLRRGRAGRMASEPA